MTSLNILENVRKMDFNINNFSDWVTAILQKQKSTPPPTYFWGFLKYF